MDIRGILDRVVVILKLGELGRDAVLNIRDALIQPGDNPLQRLCVLHAGKEGNDLVERFDGTRCVTRNERVDLLLQGCQRVPDFRVVVAFPVLSFGYHTVSSSPIFQCFVAGSIEGTGALFPRRFGVSNLPSAVVIVRI